MTNDFNQLSAENEFSRLIQVASNEGEQPIDTQHKPIINHAKLVLHNLCVPMDKRISAESLQAKVSFARARGNLVAMHARIHAEVSSVINKMHEQEDTLMAL